MISCTSIDPDVGLTGAATCPGCGQPARLRGRLGDADVYSCEGEDCSLVFEVVSLEARKPPGRDSGGLSDSLSCRPATTPADEDIHVGRLLRIGSRENYNPR
jgi:hypothetical protein